ncbi:hypothetical protein CMALT394_660002 [Carnobacterium maltaromaticum]|nr:hypothetical protein CMALT394_660002 [Carnobacterium maltaromaticum]
MIVKKMIMMSGLRVFRILMKDCKGEKQKIITGIELDTRGLCQVR